MPSEVKVYINFFANTTVAPTGAQWLSVGTDMVQRAGTLARQLWLYGPVRNVSQYYLSFTKLSANNRRALLVIEIHPDDVDNAVTIINSIATTRGITGTTVQKAQGILTKEIQEAAVRQGFSGAQAALVSCENVVAWTDRMAAISAVQTYLANNNAAWHV
jgi:hypothetical protein